MNNKIAVIGSNGQLGSALIESFGERAYPINHSELSIEDRDSYNILYDVKPSIIINTAAFHKTAECEKKVLKSFNINSVALKYLSDAANELNALLIHISTDYVFDGTKKEPYTEEDVPNPINIYGMSKYIGEKIVSNYTQKYYIVRVSSLFGGEGSRNKGSNFVKFIFESMNKNKEVNIVKDIIMTVSYTKHVANAIAKMIEKRVPYGIYHLVNDGSPISWYTFAEEIINICCEEKKELLHPIDSSMFNSDVRRPLYSALSVEKIKKQGIVIPHWKEALKEYISFLENNRK